jgi:hypothetical protein
VGNTLLLNIQNSDMVRWYLSGFILKQILSTISSRSVMIRDQAMQLGAACTIATRYSAIRRQGTWQSR